MISFYTGSNNYIKKCIQGGKFLTFQKFWKMCPFWTDSKLKLGWSGCCLILFILACKHNQLKIAKWIEPHIRNSSFVFCCDIFRLLQLGHVEILDYLLSLWDFTSNDRCYCDMFYSWLKKAKNGFLPKRSFEWMLKHPPIEHVNAY